MSFQLLHLEDGKDDLLMEEIEGYIENNDEFRDFIKSFTKNRELSKLKELLKIKISLSLYTYENLCYYLFVMKSKRELTDESFNFFISLVKEIVKEDDPDATFEHESEELHNAIEKAKESLNGVDVEEFIDGAYTNIVNHSIYDAYIYARALFDMDVIVDYDK